MITSYRKIQTYATDIATMSCAAIRRFAIC
jgi:hypothetical protein